jgi:putative iron-regulated protein
MHIPARLKTRGLGLFMPSLAICLTLTTVGCDDSQPEPKPTPITQPQRLQPIPASASDLEILAQFQQRSSELLEALNLCGSSLNTLGAQFLQQPTMDNLNATRQQWQACWEIYQASTVLLGMTEQQQQALQQIHSQLGNRLDMPGFIDSVQGYPFSGIVNDASLPLSIEILREQHGLTDPSDVSIGFDVVAFLLWGEQRYNSELPARSEADFQPVSLWEDSRTDLPVSEHANNRRRLLLALTLDIVQQDSESLLAAWLQDAKPSDARSAHDWQLKQLDALQQGLAQMPDNQQLITHLQSWLDDQIIPGAAASAIETETITQRLSQAIDNLLIRQD